MNTPPTKKTSGAFVPGSPRRKQMLDGLIRELGQSVTHNTITQSQHSKCLHLMDAGKMKLKRYTIKKILLTYIITYKQKFFHYLECKN